jgi:putative ABC transport system substrate-binding protein
VTRRTFITLLGSAVAWPMAARAQQPDRRRRLGVLMAYSETDPEAQSFVRTFVTGLRELGWTDGGNLHIDYRWAIGDIERMSALAQELVALQPDAILANTTPVTAALRHATRTIPIVFVIVSDPVGAGFVESLARPGGNITGFINVEAAMGGKWLELLKEMVPGIKRAAILFNPTTAPGGGAYFLPAFEAAARSLAISPIVAPVRDGTEIEDAISAMGREPNSGVVTMTDGSTLTHRARIISGANRYKLPLIGPSRLFARDGALLSYGHDTPDIFRRAAPYVDRILRGANPSQLPVQVPTKFELCINLKTAKAIGIEVPPMLLARADEVIE